MFQRKKITVSDECMEWLKKVDSFETDPEHAVSAYDERCAQIQEEILRTITTTSKESNSPNGKTEVVVEVRLARARKLDITMVVTNVYAVVYAKNNKKKYCITLDENDRFKRVFEIDNDMFISKDGGSFFEQLKTIKRKCYKISM